MTIVFLGGGILEKNGKYSPLERKGGGRGGIYTVIGNMFGDIDK